MFWQKKKDYWFRPKRLGIVAVYVPANRAGWITTLVLLAFAAVFFLLADAHSHSASDTISQFLPWGLLFMVIYDWFCFRTGEYPSWWRKWE